MQCRVALGQLRASAFKSSPLTVIFKGAITSFYLVVCAPSNLLLVPLISFISLLERELTRGELTRARAYITELSQREGGPLVIQCAPLQDFCSSEGTNPE